MADEDFFNRPGARREMMDRMRRAYLELNSLVDGLSEEELSAPRGGGWAIKDHLSHLAAWEEGMAALLRREPRYETMGLTGNLQGLSEDEENDIIFRQRAGLSGAEAREQLRASHELMMAVMENLRDEDVHAPYSSFAIDEKGAPDRPVRLWVVGNTFGHYEEHIGWIRDMLAE